jgi:hypothetical protein
VCRRYRPRAGCKSCKTWTISQGHRQGRTVRRRALRRQQGRTRGRRANILRRSIGLPRAQALSQSRMTPPTDHSPAPAPNPDRSPPSNPDRPPPPSLTLTPASSTGPHQSTDDHPPPNSETSLAIPAESVSKSESEDFLDKLLKGKLKRHISGPGAVNSV